MAGNDDLQTGLPHPMSDGVIVRQLVGDGLEAADPRQCFSGKRNCRADARPRQAEREPEDRAGQEMIMHRHGGRVATKSRHSAPRDRGR